MKSLTTIFFFVIGISVAGAQSAAEWIAKGDQLDSQQKTSQALAAYLEAEKISPNDPELLIKVATQYGESMVDAKTSDQERALGEKALAYSQRAVKLAPSLSDAHLAVAVCYGRLLDLVPAKIRVDYSRRVKASTEKALELNPKSDLAWHMLGRWHQAMADVGPLTRGLVKLIYGGLPPSSIEDSVSYFERAVRLNPSRVAHQVELGRSLAMAGKKDAAIAALRRGLSLPSRERDDPETKERGKATLEQLGYS